VEGAIKCPASLQWTPEAHTIHSRRVINSQIAFHVIHRHFRCGYANSLRLMPLATNHPDSGGHTIVAILSTVGA
jgi:hypothetical protein